MTMIQCSRRVRSHDILAPFAPLELTRFDFDVYNRAERDYPQPAHTDALSVIKKPLPGRSRVIFVPIIAAS